MGDMGGNKSSRRDDSDEQTKMRKDKVYKLLLSV